MKNFLKLILYQPFYNIIIFLVFFIPGHSLGWAVVILTVLIRLAILPTTKSIARQQAMMAKLKPELEKLQAKYKKDHNRQAKETMAFYKRHNISPFGSCLPMIIQLVILLVLFRVFLKGFETVDSSLLYPFIPVPDSINPNFFGINLNKPDLWILPILTGVFQFIQSWQMTPKGKQDKEDKSALVQKQMVFIFPLITIYIARRFPAALPLYWMISSIISIIQQHYVLRQVQDIDIKKSDKLLESGKTVDQVVEQEEKKEELEKSAKKGVNIIVRKKLDKKERR